MPRKPRFYLPGVPVHVLQRGNDRQAVFFADEDCAAYLSWLREGAEQHGCLVHAYVPMAHKEVSTLKLDHLHINRGQNLFSA